MGDVNGGPGNANSLNCISRGAARPGLARLLRRRQAQGLRVARVSRARWGHLSWVAVGAVGWQRQVQGGYCSCSGAACPVKLSAPHALGRRVCCSMKGLLALQLCRCSAGKLSAVLHGPDCTMLACPGVEACPRKGCAV